MRLLKKLLCLLFIVNLILPSFCYAEAPYRGYNYNTWYHYKYSVPSPNSYLFDTNITGEDLNIGKFNKPQDIYVDENNKIYILDTGNNRIVILDSKFNLIRIVNSFYSDKGEENLKDAEGLYVDKDNNFIIADTGNNRILVTNQSGKIEKIILKPDSHLIPSEYIFRPAKIVENHAENKYILARGLYQGALVYNKDWKFIGFFGANQVRSEETINNSNSDLISVIINKILKGLEDFWRNNLVSKEKRKRLEREVPIEYTNFDIDKDNFIYTCTKFTSMSGENRKEQLKKLNPVGVNILRYRPDYNEEYRTFGDIEKVRIKDKELQTEFVDIEVDDNGFIHALDKNVGRIFEYDQKSNLLSIFGGLGYQKGVFNEPIALESCNNKIMVLDAKKDCISVFSLTPFGDKVRKAINLYNDGLYEDAIKPWKEVLKEDTNYSLAYVGLGKAYYEMGDYKASMNNYKLGKENAMYSKALKEYKKQKLRQNFGVIFITIVVVLILLTVYLNKKNKKKKLYENAGRKIPLHMTKRKLPVYTMMHPVLGFEKLKYEKKGSINVANTVILIYFVSTVCYYLLRGFSYRYISVEEYNILWDIVDAIFLVILWCLCNWAITTLMDGEGKLKEIWVVKTFSFMPIILVRIIFIVLSHVISIDGEVFLDCMMQIGSIWSLILLIVGIQIIHQYSFKKTIGSLILTEIGLRGVQFLFMLVFSLFMQIYTFIHSVATEIIIRI